MNIGLGFYEIFARIVPGAFYLVFIIQLGLILNLFSFDFQMLNDLKLIPSLGLAVITYSLGQMFYPISIYWNRLFKAKDALDVAYLQFKNRNPNWRIEFASKDWRILFAYIRNEKPNLAGEIEKQHAFYLMLGSISFGLLLLSINQVIKYFLTNSWLNLLYFICLLIASVILTREGRFFQARFYQMIFETILSSELNLDHLVKYSLEIEDREKS